MRRACVARQDARGLPALRALRITSNPARDLVTIEGATRARERALSLAELRAYWKRLVALPDLRVPCCASTYSPAGSARAIGSPDIG